MAFERTGPEHPADVTHAIIVENAQNTALLLFDSNGTIRRGDISDRRVKVMEFQPGEGVYYCIGVIQDLRLEHIDGMPER